MVDVTSNDNQTQKDETMITTNNDNLVCGMTIKQDLSGGQGHCWRSVAREDIPANIVEEIECEIIDGGKDECDDYVASNGQHYRWA